MARLREFDEETALRQAQALFWRQGYEGTSYAELMAATGLGKGSLYAAFGDKRALYLETLSLYIGREVAIAVDLLRGETDGRTQPAAKRLHTFLSFPIAAVEKNDDRRGCFLCNAAIEQAPEDPEVGAVVSEGMGRMRNALDVAVKQLAAEAGRDTPAAIGTPKARTAIADQLLALYFGLRVMARGGLPVSQLKRARDAALKPLIG